MITKGKFPENGVITPSDFGDKETVDSILAMDLFEKMLQKEPEHRPTADRVLSHPFYWDVKNVIDFFSLVGDDDNVSKESFIWDEKVLPKYYGPIAPVDSKTIFKSSFSILKTDTVNVIGESWVDTVTKDAAIFQDMQRSQCSSIRKKIHSIFYLIKYIRNKNSHRIGESVELKELFGNDEGFLNYWTGKFPKLLMYTYKNFEPKPE